MTTDQTSQRSFAGTNPEKFLEEIYQIDPIAAIRVADKLTDMYLEGQSDDTLLAMYNAAQDIMCRQTVFRRCELCGWAILDKNSHMHCADHRDDDIDEAMCQGGCNQPDCACTCAEIESFRNHDPADGVWTP